MSNIGDGFKNIFLAGIGALAYTGEKGKEIIDQLVAKGEITLEQGRELNEELQSKADETTKDLRESALESVMSMMTPEDREKFAAKAAEIAAEKNAADAKAKADAEAEAEAQAEDEATVEAEITVEAEEVQEDAAEDAEQA